ncbi:MAG: sensor histidine kinase [Chloroflexi bacterium]|nr:sensor histidine kinase [Chloroflexota bacterium]
MDKTRTTDLLQQLQELVRESAQEQALIQKELREIDVLIRQSASEVERLSQRNVQITNKVHQMEMNLDTYPREDIRTLYQSAQEAQMRLFMMRSQVEQLRNKQRNLERYSQGLQRFVEVGQHLPAQLEIPDESTAHDADQQAAHLIIEAQEQERKRLARQMHDGPAQSLTNLILQAEICERLFDNNTSQARTELASLKTAANSTFQKIRDFIFDLRPMMLDDLGLVPTLRRHIENFEKKTGIATSLRVIGTERRLSPDLEVTLFRAIQELLLNVELHANSSQIQIMLDLQDRGIIATVEDNGRGFDVAEAIAQSRAHKTLGLASVRQRVEMLNGTVRFQSTPGRGTQVRIELDE